MNISAIWNYILHFLSRVSVHLFPFLASTAWPIVALCFIFIFRKQLRVVISRIKGGKGGGFEIITQDFGDGLLTREFTDSIRDVMPDGSWDTGEKPLDGVRVVIGPRMAGSIYYLSHDLMLCYCALITGAEREIIVHTLRTANSNIEKFAINTKLHLGLRKLLQEAEKTDEGDWTEKRRKSDARKIWLISRHMGEVIWRGSEKVSETKPQSDVS
jgi:hypothetical protein